MFVSTLVDVLFGSKCLTPSNKLITMNPFGQESIAHTHNSRLGDQVYIAEFKMNRTNKK